MCDEGGPFTNTDKLESHHDSKTDPSSHICDDT